MKRPKRIIIKYADPFDGTLLCENNLHYSPRQAADGFYTRSVDIMKEGLKRIQSHILRGRTPRAKISYVY